MQQNKPDIPLTKFSNEAGEIWKMFSYHYMWGFMNARGIPMKRIGFALPMSIVAVLIGGLLSVYAAGFSTWESVGGSFKFGTGVTTWGTNRLDVFGVGQDNAMWHMYYDGAGFSQWESVGGGFKSAPGCTSWGKNRIDCFAVGLNNAMWHMYKDDNAGNLSDDTAGWDQNGFALGVHRSESLSDLIFTWECRPPNHYDFFRVHVRISDGREGEVQVQGGNQGSYREINAVAGATYTFQVEGCDEGTLGSKCTDWSQLSFENVLH